MEEGVVDERRHAAEARAVALELVDLAGPVAGPLSPASSGGPKPTGLHVSFQVDDMVKCKLPCGVSPEHKQHAKYLTLHVAPRTEPTVESYLQDLSYTVQVRPPKGSVESRLRKVPLKLLDRVTAHFQPGEMTALMGPSGCGESLERIQILLLKFPPMPPVGFHVSLNPWTHNSCSAGKTTLLDVISGRKTSGNVEGDILYGISKPSKSFLARNTGQYSMQPVYSTTISQLLTFVLQDMLNSLTHWLTT